MRQPDKRDATLLIKGDKTDRQMPDGRWVPARSTAHRAFSWTWRWKMAWSVLTGKADALFWEEE